ncbi:peroxisomal membrane protein 11A [Gastrophryne carolinensis]
MESFVKFTNQSQGRDRLFRATQYACMLLGYMLENKAGREQLVMKLKRVASSMSSGRKLFQLGNFIHAIESSKAAIKLPDPVLCYCLTAANLNKVLYHICDTVLWGISVELVSDINKKKWRLRATRWYFYSLLFHIARDLYVLKRSLDKEAKNRKQLMESSDLNHNHCSYKHLDQVFILLFMSLKNNPPLLLDVIKNVCDLVSPLEVLGVYKSSQGLIGTCGLVSSIIGILTTAQPFLRLQNK